MIGIIYIKNSKKILTKSNIGIYSEMAPHTQILGIHIICYHELEDI